MDLISRQDAIDGMKDRYYKYGRFAKLEELVWVIEKLPAVQPKTKKGKWILKKELVPLAYDTDPLDWDNYDEDTHSEWKEYYHCSECDWKSGWFKGGNYCKNCGADMREGGENVPKSNK